jgi:3-(3-hydroxy-phenyl)propionate hydroxylase
VTQPASVVIAGAGLVGLTLAIDLTLQGVPVVVLERRTGVAEGSRSICQARRTLEIWDRLGVGEAMRARGVTWRLGRVFHGADELYSFDLAADARSKAPPFVNLQQNLVEDILHARLAELGVAVRFGHALTGVAPRADGVTVSVEGPDGAYDLEAGWLVSCEGVRSTARRALGLDLAGEVFQDKFLITDIRLHENDQPEERWFWFDPPFHDGQTALRHKQADDVWRIDLQLGWDADADAEARPEAARARVAKMLGHDRFELVWVSVYVFQCRSLDAYVHGRVIFAGDSAHQVSPFGARGGNGGVQDADNLAWKLARIVKGTAPVSLLDSYDAERLQAARENILNSSRSTNFMSPKSALSRALRDETLALAARAPFARALVNPGRLSVPAHLTDSMLSTDDDAGWATGAFAPGSPAVDAPIQIATGRAHMLDLLRGGFVALTADPEAPTSLDVDGEPVKVLAISRDLGDTAGALEAAYDLTPGATLLFRPDQHLALRRRTFDTAAIAEAVRRATGRGPIRTEAAA